MKLNLKISSSEPRTEKIKLDSRMVDLLDQYIKFYQQEYKTTLTASNVIAEMVTSFMKSDRHFMRWYRLQEK